ncbi:MAG: NADAR family protein [Nitratireductor sp.]
MTIYFYSQTEEYAEFSNFAPYGVELDDEWWPTVEHYFQAQKFLDETYRLKIRRAFKPKDASNLGRSREFPIREDWEAVKDEVMLSAIRKKFATHPIPKKLLLSTGKQKIVENAPMDAYWGCRPDGQGLNKLGKILVQVREELALQA